MVKADRANKINKMRNGERQGFGGRRPILVCLLVVLASPFAVLGEEVTLYVYNFDDPDLPEWGDTQYPSGRTGPIWGNMASFTAHDGYAYGNLSGVDRASVAGSNFYGYSVEKFLFRNIEIRLRLGSDNKLESDYGGGNRRWGFRSGEPDYGLTFRTSEPGILTAMDQWNPKGHPGIEMLGFVVTSKLGQFNFWQHVEGIDLTEWHTYKILWEPEIVTFLIDDAVVAITDVVPDRAARAYLRMASGENLTLKCQDEGGEEVCADEYMQVDYIRLFTSREQFDAWSEEMTVLFTAADEAMRQAGTKGIETSKLREDLYDKATEYWYEGHYNHLYAKPYLETLIDYLRQWDQVMDLFSQAREDIQEAEQQGMETRTINMMKGYYGSAEKRWEEYNIEGTKQFLQNIPDIPGGWLFYAVTILGLLLKKTTSEKN